MHDALVPAQPMPYVYNDDRLALVLARSDQRRERELAGTAERTRGQAVRKLLFRYRDKRSGLVPLVCIWACAEVVQVGQLLQLVFKRFGIGDRLWVVGVRRWRRDAWREVCCECWWV